MANHQPLLEAKAVYTRRCETNPLDADAWVALGTINRQLGLFEASEQCNRRALEVQSRHAPAHHALGAALQDQGRVEEAISCYRTAIGLQPDLVDAHYFLGNALRVQGQLEEAVACYREAVRLRTGFLEALSNLGATLRQLGQYQEALQFLQRARRINPHSPYVLNNLGGVLAALDRPDEAIPYLAAAMALDPQFVDAHYLLASIWQHLGRFDHALTSYRVALELRPNEPSAIAGIAEILEIRGAISEAGALIRPLIEAGSRNTRLLAVYGALARDTHERETVALLLEERLAHESSDRSGQVSLHYALGKLYDALSEYDKAFAHYDLAKMKTRAQEKESFQRQSPAKQTRRVSVWTEAGDAAFWASLPRATHHDERSVFVVGMQRSGTTLAEQILASHPAVHGAGELQDVGHIADALRRELGTGAGYPRCLGAITPEILDRMARRYLDRLDALAPQALRIVDKMPGNFQRLGLISLLFPKAHIIHMMRDPLDTCLSIYFQKFNTANSYAFDLTDLGRHYRAYRRLMRYWRDTLKMPLIEIQYEDLATDPDEHIQRMVAFCGLEWDARCLRFYETQRDVNTPSYEQVRQPMYTQSIGRWKHYKRHLGPLIAALQE
ncbi:MAG TPA: sulfotransferase [Gammaproteobacteria bacterium]|nr:sulfotransferase [Gammaproteobacteria bacterium]